MQKRPLGAWLARRMQGQQQQKQSVRVERA